MKRGAKPDLPSTKTARGTFRNDRDGSVVEIVDPGALPQQPTWLTDEGKLIWLDDIGRVSSTKLATENDSTIFANYCNLQGAIATAWRKGEVPPITALTEARRMAEQFGLFGRKSRVMAGGKEPGEIENPFRRNGRR